MTEHERLARECATAIGDEVKRLGQWKGLGAALARSNVEKIIIAMLDRVAAEARAEEREKIAREQEGQHVVCSCAVCKACAEPDKPVLGPYVITKGAAIPNRPRSEGGPGALGREP